MSKPRPFAVGTHQGKVRPRNEDFVDEPQMDAAVVGTRGMLFIVADGVGGAKDGDVASQMAVRAMRDAFNAQPHPDVRECLSIAIAAANTAVFREAQRRGKAMATTLTAAVVRPDGIVTANVGDSRVYVCNKARGTIQQLTEDHTELQEAVTKRKISPEAARQMPRSGAITRAIGIDAYVTADVAVHPTAIEKGSVLLLCTDGLYSEVPDAVMATVLRKAPTDEAVRRLTQMALTAGGRDNITLAVVDVDRVVEVVKGEMKRMGGVASAGRGVGVAAGSGGAGASASGPGDARVDQGAGFARTIGEDTAGAEPRDVVVHETIGRRFHREAGARGAVTRSGGGQVAVPDSAVNVAESGGSRQRSKSGRRVAPLVAVGMASALLVVVALLPDIFRRPIKTVQSTPVSPTDALIVLQDTPEQPPVPEPRVTATASTVAPAQATQMFLAAFATDTPSAIVVAAIPSTSEASVSAFKPGTAPTRTPRTREIHLEVNVAGNGCIHIDWQPKKSGDLVNACHGDGCNPIGIYVGDSAFSWDPGKPLANRPDLHGDTGTYRLQVESGDGTARSDAATIQWPGGSCAPSPVDGGKSPTPTPFH